MRGRIDTNASQPSRTAITKASTRATFSRLGASPSRSTSARCRYCEYDNTHWFQLFWIASQLYRSVRKNVTSLPSPCSARPDSRAISAAPRSSRSGATVPVGAELDLHCHLTEAMVRSATVLVAYKEYPHVDIAERPIASPVCGVWFIRSPGSTVLPMAAGHASVAGCQ